MKKLLLLVIIFAGVAFGQTTPNIGLNIPSYGAANWNTLLNTNFSDIDLDLSGGASIPALTITGNLTTGGTGSFLSVASTGATAGIVSLTAGSTGIANCLTSQVCIQAPATATKYTMTLSGTGPTVPSVMEFSTVSGSLSTQTFTAMPPQLYEVGLITSVDKIYTNTQALTAGAATHTFANSFTFTSSSTFGCNCTDQTGTNACKAVPASATTVTLTGTTTDTLWLSCSGH